VLREVEGMYDYFCAPHRRWDGRPDRCRRARRSGRPPGGEGVPPAAFPSVERIMAEGIGRLSGLPAHASAALDHGP
jgi:hypothetical protein